MHDLSETKLKGKGEVMFGLVREAGLGKEWPCY